MLPPPPQAKREETGEKNSALSPQLQLCFHSKIPISTILKLGLHKEQRLLDDDGEMALG